MPRLPPSPELEWKDDGTPVATRHGDVYFSAQDGLAESRTVFLKGNGLPERWAGRERFTVAETGFGTGLNLLALWDLWRKHRPSPTAWLDFVSFEAFPLRREDAARALSVWPEIGLLTTRLLERWPHPARGVRRIDWPDDGISLTLHIGDIAETLPQADFRADAWFLDGFSPARNEDMWYAGLYPQIAAHSAPDATAATFTVAGAVRRGLASAGFEVEKAPGHGRKRERLVARFTSPPPASPADTYGLRSPKDTPNRIAIIGAGIMGATLAAALKSRGADPVIFDRANGPGAGASGNRLALVMPRLDAADTVQARLLIDAYLAARSAYAGRPGVHETTVTQPPRDEADRTRFAKVLADPPLPLEDLESLASGGLLHKRALILEPARLLASLLEGVEFRWGEDAAPSDTAVGTAIGGEAFDAVILASGMAVATVAPWLGLVGKLGQVEAVEDRPVSPVSAIAAGHYGLALEGTRLWGATFETAPGNEPVITDAARAANAAALDDLSPWWRPQVRDAPSQSRAGIRATMPDRLPVAGPLPDLDAAREVFAGLAKGQAVDGDAPLVPSVWLATGLGSRGFTFAPWIANGLTALMLGAPWPLSRPAFEAISPMRMILRGLKRGQL